MLGEHFRVQVEDLRLVDGAVPVLVAGVCAVVCRVRREGVHAPHARSITRWWLLRFRTAQDDDLFGCRKRKRLSVGGATLLVTV
ncbi:hypothetical protein GCM10023083_56760 [Streptomyces phyllanthi]